MKRRWWLIAGIIWTVQWWWIISLNYPPSSEQLNLGVGQSWQLWVLRGVCFGALVLVLKITLKGWALILAAMSPVWPVLWMSYPWEIVKILTISLMFYLGLKKGWRWWLIVIISGITIFGINKFILKQDLAVLSSLSIKKAQSEVMERFIKEDSLREKIEIPLTVRRLVYNKYWINLKNTANQILGFWDLESGFFQEVHPLEQKSIVIFFWPEIILLALGLWAVNKNNDKDRLVKPWVVVDSFMGIFCFERWNTG